MYLVLLRQCLYKEPILVCVLLCFLILLHLTDCSNVIIKAVMPPPSKVICIIMNSELVKSKLVNFHFIFIM
jgi:hypothetical protein